ncbi:MAG: hypothetical protein RI945_109, partial [Candidatus Parcubacteria bacterium]
MTYWCNKNAVVAQLVRAPPCHGGGRGFESHSLRRKAMLQALKKFFDGRIHHHDVVLFSSFSYILCAMLLGGKNSLVIAFLLLVFLTSLFYHSYPHNIYFRIADWIASLTFILY